MRERERKREVLREKKARKRETDKGREGNERRKREGGRVSERARGREKEKVTLGYIEYICCLYRNGDSKNHSISCICAMR